MSQDPNVAHRPADNGPEGPAAIDWDAFQLVALDLDGTLAGPDGRVSPAGLHALQAAERAGLHPVIVTGRALPAAMGIWLRAGLTRPVIVCGGALITWPSAGRALWERPLEPAVVDRALDLALTLGLAPFLYGPDAIVTDRRGPWRDRLAHLNEIPIPVIDPPPAGPGDGPAETPAPGAAVPGRPGAPWAGSSEPAGAGRQTAPAAPMAPPTAPSGFNRSGAAGPSTAGPDQGAGPDPAAGLAGWHRGRVYKVILAGEPEQAAAVRAQVEQGLEDLPAVVVATLPGLLEIIRPDATKEAALAELCRLLGVPRERVIAVGDGENDLGMIRWAGLGVAVANARPEVRAAARLVIGHHADEGVARFLQAVVARRGRGPAPQGPGPQGPAPQGPGPQGRHD
ncbi:HAD family hydrolase [Thermaerobacter litoralis]